MSTKTVGEMLAAGMTDSMPVGTLAKQWETWERLGLLDVPVMQTAAGATVAVVDAAAAENAGKVYWERTRQLRVVELNDVGWEDLSPVRRIELTEEALAIAAPLVGKAAMAEASFSPGDWPEGAASKLVRVAGSAKQKGVPSGDVGRVMTYRFAPKVKRVMLVTDGE